MPSQAPKTKPSDRLTTEHFLAGYAAPVQQVADRARASIRKAVPGCAETLDAKARVIGYGFGAGYVDTVLVLIFSKTGVKLGIPYGSSLNDPEHLLRGEGRLHRHIPLKTPEQVASHPVQAMIRSALSAYRARRKAKP
jgi:hypothetical protein